MGPSKQGREVGEGGRRDDGKGWREGINCFLPSIAKEPSSADDFYHVRLGKHIEHALDTYWTPIGHPLDAHWTPRKHSKIAKPLLRTFSLGKTLIVRACAVT